MELKLKAWNMRNGYMDIESFNVSNRSVICRFDYESGGYYSQEMLYVSERSTFEGSKKHCVLVHCPDAFYENLKYIDTKKVSDFVSSERYFKITQQQREDIEESIAQRKAALKAKKSAKIS